jgi:hypothetical protein
MTLEQAFPGLRNAPGSAVIAVAETFFDFSGPARKMTDKLAEDLYRSILADIRNVDPYYRPHSTIPVTLEGQINSLNKLRFDRAAMYLRLRDDVRPLQAETVRLVQSLTDRAYEAGVRLLRTGSLPVRLSPQEALGNYIDRRVRRELRQHLNIAGIDSAGSGPVRVNRRENDSSPSEQLFRRPDFRIGEIAYDVTLARKSLRDPQIRGFFDTDFRPVATVIIRPSQLGSDHTYAIRRPEKKNAP